MQLNTLFDNILDLPGVEGACLFAVDGPIFLNRMPSFISDEVFVDAQRRIAAMYETIDDNFLPCDDYILKFDQRWMMIRRKDAQVLIVLAGDQANLASTRMVTNMAMKHFTAEALADLQQDARSNLRTEVKTVEDPVADFKPAPADVKPAASEAKPPAPEKPAPAAAFPPKKS